MIHDRLGYNYGPSSVYADVAHYLIKGEGFVTNQPHQQKMFWAYEDQRKLLSPDQFTRPPEHHQNLKPVHKFLPGYPYLLGLTYKIFGHEKFIYIQIIQAVLSASACFLIFGMARPFFSPRVSYVATVLYAVWLPEARLSLLPYHDAFIPFITVAANYLYVRGLMKGHWGFHVGAGALLGCSGYFRTDLVLFPIFWVVLGWFYSHKRQLIWGQALGTLLMILILLPWGFRNLKVLGNFSLIRASFWHVAWEGLGQYKNPVGAVASDRDVIAMVKKERPELNYLTHEYNQYMKEKFLNAIKAHPVWYVTTFFKRAVAMLYYASDWGFPIRDDNEYDQFIADGGTFLGFMVSHPDQFLYRVLPRIGRYLILLSSFLGILIVRQRWKKWLPLLAAPLYYYLSHLPLYFEARILIPGMFSLLIFSSIFIIYMISKIQKSKVDLFA